MAQLKFYRKSTAPTKDLAAGAIWFNTTNKTIQIYTDAGWETYTGNINDATWENNILTITKHDGTPITLNFSDMASATVMGKMLTAVGLNADGTFKKNATNYGTTATSIGGEITAIDSVLKIVSDNLGTKNDEASKDGSAFARIANLAALVSDLTGGSTDSIEGQITAAINALRTEIVGSLGTDDSKTLEKINDELDSIISDASGVAARVKAIEDDYLKAADKTDLGNAIKALKGTSADTKADDTVMGVKAYVTDLAAGAVKANTDAIAVLNGNSSQAGSVDKKIQDAINAFAGTADGDNVIENVTELLNYVSGVDGSKTLAVAIADIADNKGKIETLNGAATTAGSVAKSVKDAIDAEVERADEAYATAEQGTKADSAVQKADVTTGATNGTIKVQGQEVSVAGLKSAAFTEYTDYATAAQGAKADSALQEITSANTAAIEIDNKSVVTPKIAANGVLVSMSYFGQPAGNSPLVDAAGAQNLVKNYVDNALAWAEF